MSQDAIDLKDVLQRVQDDHDLLIELFDIFLNDLPGKLTMLREAVAKKDCTAVREVAHSLKGASGNLSAKILFDTFLKIEMMGKNSNLDGVENLMANLDGLIEDFKICSQKIRDDFKAKS